MYENMNQALPDLSLYLERIAIESAEEPSESYLDRIIYGQQTHIPFEDLDSCFLHKSISLAIPDLFNKLVVRKRGGFCFEQNLLLTRALKDLGFDAYTVFCRCFFDLSMRDLPQSLHCAVIVTLPEGTFFCDVGYGGPQPPAAVPVNAKVATEKYGETWKIEKTDDQWYSLSRKTSEDTWERTMHFNLFRQTPQDFIAACYYCAASPQSVFTSTLMAGLRTPTGNLNIMDRVFTKRENGVCCRRELNSQKEVFDVLEKEFRLSITQEDKS